MLQVIESPTFNGFFFIADEDGEVHHGPYFYRAEAEEKLEEINNAD